MRIEAAGNDAVQDLLAVGNGERTTFAGRAEQRNAVAALGQQVAAARQQQFAIGSIICANRRRRGSDNDISSRKAAHARCLLKAKSRRTLGMFACLLIVDNQSLTTSAAACEPSVTLPDCGGAGERQPEKDGVAAMSLVIDLKLPKDRLDNRAADLLREQILSGRFPPGLRLVEATLAEKLGVSRGTIRAALSQLAHEGLVLQVAYTKWMVPELSAADAWELYTLRGSLEGLAARLAAEHRTPESMRILSGAHDRLAKAVASGQHAPVAAADLALHKTIVAITGHRRLIGQYKLLEQQVRHYIVTSNAQIVDLHTMLDEHEPMVKAIADGDAARAERLAREHNAPEVRRFAADLARAGAHSADVPPVRTRGRRTNATRRRSA